MTEQLPVMSADVEELNSRIARAVADGRLMESTAKNICTLLAGTSTDLYLKAINQLTDGCEWSELNDRFYQTLAFGTGGLRGRTIGKIVTAAERGNAREDERPQFPCVGTNAMNFYNVSRATQGLVSYVREWHLRNKIDSRPKIVIAHDTRFFSKEFTELAARVASENGCDACIFDGPRSTPELSFAVRHLNARAGIVITASHNPPHDNGYKVYFADGAQVIEPHASGIIDKVNASASETYEPLPKDRQGAVTTIGRDVDEAYMERLATIIVDPKVVQAAKSLRIVFTPLHGTGSVILKQVLKRLGFNFQVVAEQDRFDPQFPTVKSPNPENAEALQMGIALAEKTNSDLVIATDPDCDRLGVAVRSASGEMKLISGNQIGSLLAYYRIKTLFETGVLNKENASRAVVIKTFVTTDLQKVIAEHYGLRCIETLTGFKYFGAKLEKYERALPAEVRQKYRRLSEGETRTARLAYSSFYVFGSEESYGYSGADFVRDKDGNAGAIMFCEVAAYAKSENLTADQLLDEIFAIFGYFGEKNGSLYFEGAEGTDKIARLLDSYASAPPADLLGAKVTRLTNFETERIREFSAEQLEKIKMEIDDRLERLWDSIQRDVHARLAR